MIRFFNGLVLYPLLEKKSEKNFFSKVNELRKFEKLELQQQEEIRKKELIKLLEYCKANIPYYQEVFSSSGFDILNIEKDIKYIQKLPILTKEIIRERTSEIKAPTGVHIRKTGGSTGQSVFFYYDNYGLDWTSAINQFAYEMVGNTLVQKDCHISSELGISPLTGKAKFLDWLKLFAQNRKRLFITSFSDKDLEESFKNLKKIRPYLLQGHPSSAYAIAQYIKRKKLTGPKYVKIFEPSGEMLTEKMVKSIEKHLGAHVTNRYGNAEFGVMAHSERNSPFTKLKVFDRAFYMEECEESNLIVTSFTNYGMPLIRYNTGDIGTVKKESNGHYLYNIQGRIHDIVNIDGEDYATHYIMDYLDHKIKGIREFQIILENNQLPLINIVPEDINDIERIQREFIQRWPKGIDINFIAFSDLKTVGWRQKFRHIIDKRTH